KVKAWLRGLNFTESLSIIFNGYNSGLLVIFNRYLPLRCVRMLNDIRQRFMDDADQLNFNLRREVKDFGMIDFEIHGNFSDFAKVPEKISQRGNEPHVIPRG